MSLDTIWHLLGLSGCIIELLEKILKETVLFSSESFLLDGLNSAFGKEAGPASNASRRPNSAVGDPFAPPGRYSYNLTKMKNLKRFGI